MNMENITPRTFDIFGKKTFENPIKNNKLFNGLFIQDKNNEFANNCLKILDSNYSDVNKLKLCYLIQDLLRKGYDEIINNIITIFETYLSKISDDIQNELLTETFTTTYFLDKYDEVYNKSYMLAKYLNRIDKNIKSEGNYSVILTIRSYMFYRLILLGLFEHKKSEHYLYDIISEKIQQTQKMEDILRLFKIIQHYNKLSYFIKVDKEKYFNIDLSKKFVLNNNEGGNRILDSICNSINDNIKILLRTTEGNIAERKLNEIRDFIKLGLNLAENKTLFMLMYRANLTDRLLNGQTNVHIEDELLMSLNYFDNPELYAKIKYQINDAKSSKVHNNKYKKNVNVELRSDKYKNFDSKSINKEVANFLIGRSYAWDFKEEERLNIPPELSIYFDIFNAYYKIMHTDRELECQFDKSTAVIRMGLGGKSYKIRMTLLQLIVLTIINNAGTISARNISIQLGMPLKRLGLILNSLIAVKLINRDEKSSNDPNLLFTINTNCSFPEEQVSLISLMKKSKSNVEISDTMLKAEILSYLAQNDRSSLNNIIKHLEEKLKIKMDTNKISNILDLQIKLNIVYLDEEGYKLNNDSD